MTKTEQAKLTTLKGTASFMAENNALWISVPLIVTANSNYNDAFDDTTTKSADAGNDDSGYSDAKTLAKTIFADEASSLCGYAAMVWISSNPELYKQCLQEPTDYLSISDSDCASVGLKMYNLLNDNIASLTDDYVSAIDVKNLEKLLNTFTTTQGSSDSAHTTSPVATSDFKLALAYSMLQITNLKKAARKVKVTQPEFYKKLLAVTKVATINIHHTHIHINITDSTSLLPLPKVVATFSNSPKTAESDIKGNIVIDIFKGGNTTITLRLAGYHDFVAILNIASGKDNIFNLQMIPGVVTV